MSKLPGTDTTFTLIDENIFDNPYPAFARLREEQPVYRIPEFDAWFISRFQDAIAVLHDDEHFSKADTILTRNMHPTVRKLFSTLQQDDPDHRRIRTVLQKFFSIRDLKAFEQEVQSIVDGAIEKLRADREAELMKDFAYRIPIEVLCVILGLPKEDYALFEGWAPGLVKGFNPDPSSENWRVGARTYDELREYLIGLIAHLRGEPQKRQTIMSLLIEACDAGTISEEELLSQAVVMYVGSHETTLNLIGQTIYCLLRHPDELAKIHRNRDLVAGAVEEAIRFDGPGHMVERRVAKPIMIHGVELAEDDALFVGVASANRDPDCCENPDQFLIDRERRVDHVGLGHGIHYCLGAHLARMEARLSVASLFTEFPNLSLAEPPPLPYNENMMLRGIKRLPVQLT